MYNEILLDKNAHPIHRGELKNFTKKIPLVNASCGDKLMLYLRIESGVIVDGSFEGFGCAISQASTDILLDEIIGKSEDAAKEICTKFKDYFFNSPENLTELGDACALADIAKMPARTNCALLPWTAF